jgi:hypothetical protein
MLLGGLSWSVPASAGFFDDLGALFGGGPPRMQQPSQPFEVTVFPNRNRTGPRKPRSVRGKTLSKEAAKRNTDKAEKLDPSKDPNWFLKDPTLRAGDVVVTTRGVLVYQVHRSSLQHRFEDFVSLNQSKLVPKALRALITRMASTPTRWQFVQAAAPVPPPEGRETTTLASGLSP